MEIRLRNLRRNYGSLHAVDDVSLTIPSNTVYGIIGKSGAGKSTLVRLVSMLEKPDQGEVYYDDKRVDNLSKEELINGGRLDQGSYINVGDLALGMEYDSATMTADWDKIKDFVQIESDVTNDAYIQLLIKNAQDGLTGQFGAVETSKNTTTVEGSLGLHKAYADNGTGEKFFASQVVNGTRQAAGLTVTNNSTLSLYGEGTVGTLQGAGS